MWHALCQQIVGASVSAQQEAWSENLQNKFQHVMKTKKKKILFYFSHSHEVYIVTRRGDVMIQIGENIEVVST